MPRWSGDEFRDVVVLRHLTDDGDLMFTTLERWDDHVTVNWVAPSTGARPSKILSRWRLEDHHGTQYHASGAGSGGSANWSRGWADFVPAIPTDVIEINIVSEGERIVARFTS